VIECNTETKQLHPTLSDIREDRPGFLRCPFHLTPRILDGVHFYDSICLVALYKTLNSGLGTVLSEAGHFSAFDNFVPSFFNHEWKTEKRRECANMGKINDSNYGGNCR
jgi:hypothetical protein